MACKQGSVNASQFAFRPWQQMVATPSRKCSRVLATAPIEHMRRNNLRRIEATPKAEEAWRDHVAELVGATLFPRAQS
jgi:hypothetical protein